MKKTTLRFLASSALGLSIIGAGPAAFAQQPPPPAAGAPAPAGTPAAAPPEVATPAPPEAVVETPPAPEPKKSDASPIGVSYDKGIKFESEDGNFEGKLSLRTQFRFQEDKILDAPDGSPASATENKTAFSIPRGRLQLEGYIFGKDLLYKLEFSLADKLGFAFTKDLWIEQKFSGGKLGLRLGQMKAGFNRQELVSDFASEFNERAITAEWVKGGRDIGLMLNNGYADKAAEGLEWSVALMNSFAGGKDKVIVNCPLDPTTGQPKCGTPAGGVGDWDPAIFARVGFSQGKGFKGYSEADLEGGPLRFGVGLSYKIGFNQFKKGGLDSSIDAMNQGLGLDGAVKVEGFDLAFGAFLMGLKNTETGFGFHVQAGYFITPKKLQVAARYAMVPNEGDTGENDSEVRGAINYYFHGHQWKWATDFGVLQGGTAKNIFANGTKESQLQIRSMAQLTF
jgi:phosphate-selective porin OprO/OprP